ncbi:MAG: IS3 family transposase [Paludibacteraceae bacterium]|nr:IS3 family transposase [Paludibacteraceae bacterium]
MTPRSTNKKVGGKQPCLILKKVDTGRDRFFRIIDENGLKVRRRTRKPQTTDSAHGLPTYPNLIREYLPATANRLWVSDITYIMVNDDDSHYHFCYLSLMLDAYSEEIVGWCVGPSLDTDYPLEALRMALRRIEGKEVDLIHHSDRGCQYAASREYVELLRKHGIRVSMTESGDPRDNAKAERINNTMKNELLKDKVFRNMAEVVAAVAVAVDFYNNRRPHMSIGMMTPAEAANCTGDRDMKWTRYRHVAIKAKNNFVNTEKSLPLHSGQESPSVLRTSVNS